MKTRNPSRPAPVPWEGIAYQSEGGTRVENHDDGSLGINGSRSRAGLRANFIQQHIVAEHIGQQRVELSHARHGHSAAAWADPRHPDGRLHGL